MKVCGVTREEDLAAAEELGVDWIGLNFSPRSPRRADASSGRGALAEASRFAKGVVAVFAGNTARGDQAIVAERPARRAPAGTTTLPGRSGLAVPVPVWQTVGSGRDSLDDAASWPADVLLFDAAARGAGRGDRGDVRLAPPRRDVPPTRRVFVAGGLSPENVARAIRDVHARGRRRRLGRRERAGNQGPGEARGVRRGGETCGP